MKKILIIGEAYSIIVCFLLIISCSKTTEDSPTPVPCNVSGTSVNIGSTTGGNFSEQVSTGPACPFSNITESINFNNITLNFSLVSSNAPGCPSSTSGQGILDAGIQSCLDFTYSGSPSAANVAFVAATDMSDNSVTVILSNLLQNLMRMAK